MSQAQAHVLVVDDLEDNRGLLVQLLRRAGYRVSEAQDGAQALDLIKGDRPDVLLLDLMMPVLDGFAVLEHVKAETAYLPVVVTTAATEREQRLRALSLGADEFLTKPIDAEELALRLRTLLSLKRANQELQAQKEELQAQTEELQTQSEELQAQQEELEQLNDELRRNYETVEQKVQARTAELRRQEREFRMLAEHSPDIIARYDLDLRHLYVSPAVRLATDQPPEAFLGKTHLEAGMPEREAAFFMGHLREVIEKGEPQQIEFADPGSRKRFYSTHLVPEFDENGKIETVLAVTRDITERRRLEDHSRQFELLIASVMDYAILMLDPEGHVMSWNRGAERVKGYTEGEAIGLPLSTFYAKEDVVAGKPARLLEIAAREGHVEDEGWRVRKDGTRFWASVVITAVRDEAGHLVGFGKITRDLTERRHAEQTLAHHAESLQNANQALASQTEELSAQTEELQSRHEELQTTNEQLRDLSEQLKQLDVLKDNFLAILSHKLRTPLNAILGFASVLDDEVAGPLTPQQHDYLSKILGGTEVLLALINDLLDMSRIQAGKFSLSPEPMHAADVCHDVVESLEILAERKGQQLTCNVADGIPGFTADRQRVFQVLINLVNNAIKFAPEGSSIEIRLRRDGENLLCEVEDHGPGIAQRDLPRLFERFTQLETGNTRGAKGTGLGLSISRALVEAHGGAIGVKSTLGVGSVFWFTLPLEPAAVVD